MYVYIYIYMLLGLVEQFFLLLYDSRNSAVLLWHNSLICVCTFLTFAQMLMEPLEQAIKARDTAQSDKVMAEELEGSHISFFRNANGRLVSPSYPPSQYALAD